MMSNANNRQNGANINWDIGEDVKTQAIPYK